MTGKEPAGKRSDTLSAGIPLLTGILVGCLMLCAVGRAAEPDQKALHDMVMQLMAQTKVLAVSSLTVPASQYKPDGDPSTLEIVILAKDSDGPSRVSEDGEVIFLNHASKEEQSALIAKAFDIRARRRLRGA
jgi:hypothetical protein